jgi:hypothetical protein
VIARSWKTYHYDETTLKTIEQIDVLWLKRRSIIRIVAPASRREKVLQEVRRPVFSLLERGPLAESCTYLSYDSIREIADLKHLEHLSDSVLDDYTEEAE